MSIDLSPKRSHNLPSSATPFFGREREIAEIAQRLTDPTCRLLTLTGAGGIGKSRLAARAGGELLDRFADGVWFVALEPAGAPAALVAAVADALGAPRSAAPDPAAQLFTYLSEKATLLILDGFERLLGQGGAELLADLLRAAPALTLLITSREALQLQEEWLYPVVGMPVPASDQDEDLERFAVIQLFAACARRAYSDFSLADEQAGAVRVCRLVEGAPLAVELAASWRSVLRCDAIAEEIARSVHFLQTDVRNIPERHRSMRAVFDQSWQLLGDEERRALQQLSVFRGSFQRVAAAAVAGATLPVLSALIRKSLLRLAPDGRYQLHELVRQYAEERLALAPAGDANATFERHRVYFLAFLRDRSEGMNGGRQLQAAGEIALELENIRVAWRRAVERRDIAALAGAANALYLFYQFRGRYLEGVELFEQAVQRLDAASLAAQPGASVLIYDLAWLCVRLGRLAQAQALFERCREIDAPLGPGHSSDPRLGLGLLASLRGDYGGAQLLLEQARQTGEREGHRGNQQLASYFLAGIHLALGAYDAAQECARRAYALAQAGDSRWFMAYCLIEMGDAARALGAYEQARGCYQASHAIRTEFGDPEGIAVSLAHLGAVALAQGDPTAAEEYYRQSLDRYHAIDDSGGIVAALDGLGRAECARGQVRAAARHLRQALLVATRARLIALGLSLLCSIAELLHTRDVGAAVDALRTIRWHAGASHETRARAERLLERSGGQSARAAHGQPGGDLEALTARLLAALAPLEGSPDAEVQPDPPEQPAGQSLVEPLTPRERELLLLLAAGLSYQQIAARLTIAVGSVKSHAHNIYGKLGVSNRMQAAARAAELGLIGNAER
jgi:predicted ATPase/DNA-binding CsgD family transcriptional regulator